MAVSDVASQFEAEGLTLLVADNKAGYCGVHLDKPGKPKPYLARVWRGGKIVNLGSFATAEEAALCVARSPEGQEAAKRAAEAQAPLTSEEVRQQAQAEGLALFKADNTTGYFGVPPQARQAQALPGTGVARRQAGEPGLLRHRQGGGAVRRTVAGGVGGGAGGSGEGGAGVAATGERGGPGHGPRHAARRRPQGGGRGPAMPPGAVLKEEGAVPPMPPGAFVKEEQVAPPMPPGAFFKEEGVVPPMPSDTVVKQEREVAVKQERSQDGRAKRQRKR